MSTLTLEAGEDAEMDRCECCGGTILSVFGFVYEDGDARAVYHAALSARHPETAAMLALTVGDWGEDAEGSRNSVSLYVRPTETEIQMSVTDAAESPWRDSEIHCLMNRAEALASPLIEPFFRIADFIIMNDERIRLHLNGRAKQEN